MQRKVVCVSAAIGAGAPDVASLVARRLGFRLIDEEILLRAAAEAGVEPDVVADVEHRKSLITRLLRGMGAGADGASAVFAGGPMVIADHLADDDLRNLIRAAIEETAADGDAVIVAHAASVALGAREDVLRVLVTASPETRRARYGAEHSLVDNEAEKAIAASDAERADYFKRFYGIGAERAELYDVVVNTDRLTTEEAAAIVLLAAGASA